MPYAINADKSGFRAIDTETDLLTGETFSADLPVLLPTKTDLIAYAATKRQSVADGGITVNVGTTAAPINIEADTTLIGRTDILGLVAMGASATWYQASGPITLTAAQILAMGVAVGEFISSTYAAQAAVESEINAGTITTNAQIAAYAWPANS